MLKLNIEILCEFNNFDILLKIFLCILIIIIFRKQNDSKNSSMINQSITTDCGTLQHSHTSNCHYISQNDLPKTVFDTVDLSCVIDILRKKLGQTKLIDKDIQTT